MAYADFGLTTYKKRVLDKLDKKCPEYVIIPFIKRSPCDHFCQIVSNKRFQRK